MPIYEYECRACKHQFEQLVLKSSTPHCPACGSETLERLVSQFSVDSHMTRSSSLKTARQKAESTKRDKDQAEREYLQKNDH